MLQTTFAVAALLLLAGDPLFADSSRSTKGAVRIEGDLVFTAPELLVIRDASGERNVPIGKSTAAEYAGRPLPLSDLRVGDRVAVTASSTKKKLSRVAIIEVLSQPLPVPAAVKTNGRVVVGTLLAIDRTQHTFTIAMGPSMRTVVDIRAASDATGRHLNIDDYRAGDQLFVELSPRDSAVPLAELIRFADHREAEAAAWSSAIR